MECSSFKERPEIFTLQGLLAQVVDQIDLRDQAIENFLFKNDGDLVILE